MKKYHINKVTLASTYPFALVTFFIIIVILRDIGIMQAVDNLPTYKKVLFYFVMGGGDLALVGIALYYPLMIVTHEDRISIVYIFPRSRDIHLPYSEIDHIDYPVIKYYKGRPYKAIDITLKDGKVIMLHNAYIGLTKSLDKLEGIARRQKDDSLWF